MHRLLAHICTFHTQRLSTFRRTHKIIKKKKTTHAYKKRNSISNFDSWRHNNLRTQAAKRWESVARARKRCTYAAQHGEFFEVDSVYVCVCECVCTSAIKRAAALFMTFLIQFILASVITARRSLALRTILLIFT